MPKLDAPVAECCCRADQEPWSKLAAILDDTWFIDCDIDEAMERVFQRQVAIGLRPEESLRRIAGNDRPNAELIASTRHLAKLLVPSLPFANKF